MRNRYLVAFAYSGGLGRVYITSWPISSIAIILEIEKELEERGFRNASVLSWQRFEDSHILVTEQPSDGAEEAEGHGSGS